MPNCLRTFRNSILNTIVHHRGYMYILQVKIISVTLTEYKDGQHSSLKVKPKHLDRRWDMGKAKNTKAKGIFIFVQW